MIQKESFEGRALRFLFMGVQPPTDEEKNPANPQAKKYEIRAGLHMAKDAVLASIFLIGSAAQTHFIPSTPEITHDFTASVAIGSFMLSLWKFYNVVMDEHYLNESIKRKQARR